MAPTTKPAPKVGSAAAAGKKRPAGNSIMTGGATGAPPAAKKIRTGYAFEEAGVTGNSGGGFGAADQEELKNRFVELFKSSEYQNGISNTILKETFGDAEYLRLVPVINELTRQAKLIMSKAGDGELYYSLVSDEVANKFQGLDTSARMVYQVIEKAGNMGIWTKDVRVQTNLQQVALNKIFKALEARQLIKPVKSVTAKAKKLYMLYNLQPSTELTGGVWYSDLEFDHEFISELRKFLQKCVRNLNGGRGVTLEEMREKMIQAKVSRVELSLQDVRQLAQTLVYDYLLDEIENENAAADAGGAASTLFVTSRRVTTMCEFKCWNDVLSPDFHFRSIVYEDGVTLPPHEPHYHT